MSLPERFWTYVDRTGECWLWTGATNEKGYGRFSFQVDGRRTTRVAHRLSFEATVGPIPAGLEIDHLCRVRNCVKPDHLEAVTHVENMRRSSCLAAVTARTGICQRGHALTPDNVYMRPDGSRRICRECVRIRNARRADKGRAA